MNSPTVPSDIHLTMDIHSPEWSDHDPLSSVDMSLDFVWAELLYTVGPEFVEGVAPWQKL